MLATMKDVLLDAEKRQIAVGAFNAPNLQTLHAILRAAESLAEPVILMHAEVHEEMGLCTMEEIAPILLRAAERSAVPVCVHLDHGTDYVKRGLALGFTSVMYDGSALSPAENTKNTRIAVEAAKKTGASVEAEIGSMGAREGGVQDDESIYTDPELAKKFVEETGIDALACAFGTVHGFYRREPKLDMARLSRIRELTGGCTVAAASATPITGRSSAAASARSIITPICPARVRRPSPARSTSSSRMRFSTRKTP